MRKVGLHIDKTLTTEALVLDHRTKNFITFYNTCCGYTSTRVLPVSFLGPVGPLGFTQVQGQNYCTSQWEDLTFSSTLSSSPTSIVTVDQSTAAVTGVSRGSGSVNPLLSYPKQKAVDTCITKNASAPKPTTVCDFNITPDASVTASSCDGTTSNSQTFTASGIPSGCSVQTNPVQTLFVNGLAVRTETVTWTCSGVTLTP